MGGARKWPAIFVAPGPEIAYHWDKVLFFREGYWGLRWSLGLSSPKNRRQQSKKFRLAMVAPHFYTLGFLTRSGGNATIDAQAVIFRGKAGGSWAAFPRNSILVDPMRFLM